MNKKKQDSYLIMKVFAYIATLVASIATYDIAYHFSPNDVAIFGIQITKASIALITLFTVDGLFILLDDRLPHFKTEQSRDLGVKFLVLLWAIMLSLNIASAVMNNTMDTSVLGRFSFVVYAVKVVALIYLAFYTYIRSDDPDTQRVIIENQMHWVREQGINTHLTTFSQKFAQDGAKIIAMEQLSRLVLKETGKDIKDILGEDWQVKIGGELFAKTTSSAPAPKAKSAAGNNPQPPTPPVDLTSIGPEEKKLWDMVQEVFGEVSHRVNAALPGGKKAGTPAQEVATGTVNP